MQVSENTLVKKTLPLVDAKYFMSLTISRSSQILASQFQTHQESKDPTPDDLLVQLFCLKPRLPCSLPGVEFSFPYDTFFSRLTFFCLSHLALFHCRCVLVSLCSWNAKARAEYRSCRMLLAKLCVALLLLSNGNSWLTEDLAESWHHKVQHIKSSLVLLWIARDARRSCSVSSYCSPFSWAHSLGF